MAIDIATLRQEFDSLDTCTYEFGRMVFGKFDDMLRKEAEASGLNYWINFGNSSQKGTIQKFQDQMNAFRNDVMDTSSHPYDATWDRWPAFRELAYQIAIEANAIGEGMGAEFDNITDYFTTDLPQAVEDAPGVIGNVVGKAAGGVAGAAGDVVSQFLKGAGLPLLIGAAVVIFVAIKARG